MDDLKHIVGDKYVITDPDKLDVYSHDGYTGPEYMTLPDVVVRPKDADEIARIVRLANRELIPVVPRGGGTGLAAGAVPTSRGIVVATDRLNHILEIDEENLVVVTEPGVITEDLQKAAREKGFFFAGDPSSSDSCFIGGNIATNSGGMNALKYGTTRNQVLGLEIVTPEGDIVTLGGKLRKNSTGYCLSQLIAGSEGTLGIITKAYLKLMPQPKCTMELLAVFPSAQLAVGIVPKILHSGIMPAGIEFMDNNSIRCVEQFLQQTQPHSDRGYYIIILLEGDSDEILEEQSLTINELCENNGVIEVLVPNSAKIWRARKAFSEASRARSLVFSGEDTVVPMARIADVVELLGGVAEKYGIAIHCASHAGDGNVHADILKDDMSMEDWDRMLPEIRREIYKMVYAMGGKLSGEHGIGHKRVTLMREFAHPAELKMMMAIKKALDPNNIMNPGAVVSVEDAKAEPCLVVA
ncbi:MAG: FAD-binding oxidoreductase [Rhodospirillaceae bacterium]|nr:FAD-binding oxidoreductase [Rhodospirillaceae bacterium]